MTEGSILDAALRVIDVRGVSGLKMRVLANELQVSAPTIYQHFANREAILDAVFERVAEQIVSSAPREGSWKERARTLVP